MKRSQEEGGPEEERGRVDGLKSACLLSEMRATRAHDEHMMRVERLSMPRGCTEAFRPDHDAQPSVVCAVFVRAAVCALWAQVQQTQRPVQTHVRDPVTRHTEAPGCKPPCAARNVESPRPGQQGRRQQVPGY